MQFLFFLHILLQHVVKKKKKQEAQTLHDTHVPQARLHHKNLLKSTHFCRNTGPLITAPSIYLAPDCTKDHFLLLQHHAKYAKRVSANCLLEEHQIFKLSPKMILLHSGTCFYANTFYLDYFRQFLSAWERFSWSALFKSFGQNAQLFKKLKILHDDLTFTPTTFRVLIPFELTVKVF